MLLLSIVPAPRLGPLPCCSSSPSLQHIFSCIAAVPKDLTGNGRVKHHSVRTHWMGPFFDRSWRTSSRYNLESPRVDDRSQPPPEHSASVSLC
jgi:hypothetical protein